MRARFLVAGAVRRRKYHTVDLGGMDNNLSHPIWLVHVALLLRASRLDDGSRVR